MEAALIAPCGMNCALCASYLAFATDVPRKAGRVSHCSGCRPRNKQCAFLKKRCAKVREGRVAYCFECSAMPCPDLLRVDSLYRRKYGMSMIANLEILEAEGMTRLLERQKREHSCPECGDILCVHDGKCYACGTVIGPPPPLSPLPKSSTVPKQSRKR